MPDTRTWAYHCDRPDGKVFQRPEDISEIEGWCDSPAKMQCVNQDAKPDQPEAVVADSAAALADEAVGDGSGGETMEAETPPDFDAMDRAALKQFARANDLAAVVDLRLNVAELRAAIILAVARDDSA